MVALIMAKRAALGARMMSELLRASASTVPEEVPAAAAAAPAVAAPAAEVSAKRCTKTARSLAMACLSGMTSKSVSDGWSSAAMILPKRCRLSA